ncbi:MAG: hypothetical protein JW955_21120, partial [Sedimentisphaerales bacterium]|nr:hypothetical protein [Sedimentisphaerales bacterium]
MVTRGRWDAWLVGLMIVCTWSGPVGAGDELFCGSALRVAPVRENDGAPRRYAPQRLVDVTRVTIDVTPDFPARTIRGVTTIAFTPLVRPLTELKLDAFDLNISAVESQAR